MKPVPTPARALFAFICAGVFLFAARSNGQALLDDPTGDVVQNPKKIPTINSSATTNSSSNTSAPGVPNPSHSPTPPPIILPSPTPVSGGTPPIILPSPTPISDGTPPIIILPSPTPPAGSGLDPTVDYSWNKNATGTQTWGTTTNWTPASPTGGPSGAGL